MMYFIVFGFFIRAEMLVPVQLWLGAFVAVREALYIAMVAVAAFRNPAFLLVDMAATVEDNGPLYLIIYVVSPEKFVMVSLVGYCPAQQAPLFTRWWISGTLWGGILFFDACGVAAISAAFGVGNPPVALVLGYSVTAVSLVVANLGILGKLLAQIQTGHPMLVATVFEFLAFLTMTFGGGIAVPFLAARDHPDDMGKFLLHEAMVVVVIICLAACSCWKGGLQ